MDQAKDIHDKFIFVLDEKMLKTTPLKFARSRKFQSIVKEAKKYAEETRAAGTILFVRHKEDRAAIALDNEGLVKYEGDLCLDLYWRSSPQGFVKKKSLQLDTPFSRLKTFNDLFLEFEREQLLTRNIRGEEAEFEKKYGRRRLPNEPPEGLRAKFFRETETDDGFIVINGYVFPGKNEIVKLTCNQKFMDFYGANPRYIESMTRSEFFERARHGLDYAEKFAKAESFFERKLPIPVIKKMTGFLAENDLAVLSDQRTGCRRLIMAPERFFEVEWEAEGEEKDIFVLAESKKDYDTFVGKILLGKILDRGPEIER